MKEGPNDWGLNYNIDYPVPCSRHRTDERQTFPVKVCPKCNVAYELAKDQYKKTIHMVYYDDFPKRGLYKQVCLKCK